MLDRAGGQLAILQKRYPKSKYTSTAQQALDAAKNGETVVPLKIPSKDTTRNAKPSRLPTTDKGTGTAQAPAGKKADAKPLIVLEVEE